MKPLVSHCMQLRGAGRPLEWEEVAIPVPGPGQVLLEVHACGVCRTDLHLIDGELPKIRYPIVPGHEIVGEVVATGTGVTLALGARCGVPWLGFTCGNCEFCRRGAENLCDGALFTGYQLDGGYAQHVLANERFCFELPNTMDDVHAAPLLCAGLIGYRSWRFVEDAQHLGIYGFGAAAHIVAQVARWRGQTVYAFTRAGDESAQAFARSLGAVWADSSDASPPRPLDAAIIFAQSGELVPLALKALRKGGTLICGGIHMSDIPAMPYALLWGERTIRSVANLTRRDGIEFLKIAAQVPIRTHVETFALTEANLALQRLRAGMMQGAGVLVP